MTEATLTARADGLLDLLAERELDCLLVTNLVNVRYLTGFTGTNGACVVSRDERLFITDFRYVEQAESQVRGFELVKGERELLGDMAQRLSGRAGFDDAHVSVRSHRKLSEAVGEGTELVEAAGLVERLRRVKDAEEVVAITAATELADGVYELLREDGIAGRTERELARRLEQELRERGAEPAFPTIVASGPQGALPHAVPRDAEIEPGSLVIVDMGAQLDGYCSDCTRTFATGDLPDELRRAYDVCLEAQLKGLEVARAGTDGKEADAAARAVITEAGFGEKFGHGLGHGVGIDVHEAPAVGWTSTDTLAANNVCTIEPGIYLEDVGGIRIEDLVVITDGEPEILTSFPKELLTVS